MGALGGWDFCHMKDMGQHPNCDVVCPLNLFILNAKPSRVPRESLQRGQGPKPFILNLSLIHI